MPRKTILLKSGMKKQQVIRLLRLALGFEPDKRQVQETLRRVDRLDVGKSETYHLGNA